MPRQDRQGDVPVRSIGRLPGLARGCRARARRVGPELCAIGKPAVTIGAAILSARGRSSASRERLSNYSFGSNRI